MTLHAAVRGHLGRDPMEIDTATGTRMATASVAVVLDARGPDGEAEATEWCDVVAFARLADELLRHRQGDTLSVSGRLQVRALGRSRRPRTAHAADRGGQPRFGPHGPAGLAAARRRAAVAPRPLRVTTAVVEARLQRTCPAAPRRSWRSALGNGAGS